MNNDGQVSLLLSPGELLALLSLSGADALDGLMLPALADEDVRAALSTLEESGIISGDGSTVVISNAYYAICRAMTAYDCLLILRADVRSYSTYVHDRLCVVAEYSRPDLVRLTPLPDREEALRTLQQTSFADDDPLELTLVVNGEEAAYLSTSGEAFRATTMPDLMRDLTGKE